ncbi:MAG: sigma-70 family RNA polymerase sigma factor [Candidatus Eisenbacteria bacterium]|nr:sigma-70 family RNA polymerase sigma factor [Candidatus Eisenbacteria bacterium]
MMAGSAAGPSPGPPDDVLIQKVLGGDESAFAVLMERYADLVFSVVVGIVRNETDAADVTQEAFVRAYKALPRFRGDSKFSSWLYRIAVNRSLTFIKKRKRRGRQVDIGLGPHIEASALDERPRSDPEKLVLDDEFRRLVHEAVGELPPKYRAAVTLFYIEERSYKEVAGALGIPMGTLKTHLHRARALLKEILEKRLWDERRRVV